MTAFHISRLVNENKHLINGFSCVESNEMLSHYRSKERRRILRHSKEMEDFLYEEAYEEQERGLSRTYLFVDSKENLVAYMSICNDAIRLEFEEKDHMRFPYTTIPAIKIARLAVATAYQGRGIGRKALRFAILISQMVKDYSGTVFLTLDCYSHKLGYYEKFGFVKNLYQPVTKDYDSPISMRLWIERFFTEESLTL